MIKNIHLLNLGKVDNTKLHADTAKQRFDNKIAYSVISIEGEMVIIQAEQGPVKNPKTTNAIVYDTIQLFGPYLKDKVIVVLAFPHEP